VPTPFDDDYELDLGTTYAMVQRIVEAGVSNGRGVIKMGSALGEGTMLRDTEWPALLRTAVRAADGKVPIMSAIHYKDTVRAIEDAKIAADLGAAAIQITPAIHNDPSQQDHYDYFYDISNAVDVGIMVYHTKWFNGGEIEVDTFLRMADIDNVVAIKWPGSAEDGSYEPMRKFTDRFNVIDNTASPVNCIRNGGHGYVQTVLDANPEHELKVWDLIQEGKLDEAEKLYDSVYDDIKEMYQLVSKRTGGQSLVFKALSVIVGHPLGPPRPPSKPLNDEEMEQLRGKVRSWGWEVKG
jgi:4-hydroxy-tetrahydrodipicolinate synthase